jgi:predicted N-acetyltransferase YhbS
MPPNAAYALRDHTEADLPVILAVIKAAFAEYRGVLDPPSSAERKTLEIVREELQHGHALVAEIVAEIDAEIVGCVLYHPRADGWYIDRLSVLPAHRGQGIATEMMNLIERRARAAGAPALTLGVRLVLEAQQAYYRRLGYEPIKLETHPGYASPTSVTMRKAL